MTTAISHQPTPAKNQFIEGVLKQALKRAKKPHPCLRSYVERFCAQIPTEDYHDWTESDIAAIVVHMFDIAQKRVVGTPDIRIFNPTEKKHGWQADRTVIEIVNKDRPFLIDSIAAELAHQGHVIDVLFHPILAVERKGKGEMHDLVDTHVPNPKAVKESYLHIQIETMLSAEQRRALKARLKAVSDDVISATSDWPKMLNRLDSTINSLSDFTGKVSKDKLEEAQDFLKYLYANNFTLLGYRQDDVKAFKGKKKFASAKNSPLGLLKTYTDIVPTGIATTESVTALNKEKMPVTITKLIDHYSTVHRRVPFDCVTVKILNAQGELVGRHVFIGLFTSSTYSCRTAEVPIVRAKVRETLRKASFGADTHDHKALEHILEKFPRDELFQYKVPNLVQTALGILRLQERHTTALFTRVAKLQGYISCLVYVPRDVYDSPFRIKVSSILEDAFEGEVRNFFTTLDDSPLARILFTVKTKDAKTALPDLDALEDRLVEVSRAWADRFKHALIKHEGKEKGYERFGRYKNAFSAAYKNEVDAHGAVYDIRRLDELSEANPLSTDFYSLKREQDHEYRLKVYNYGAPATLSDILPILEHMGLRVMSERPYRVRPSDNDQQLWIHDFLLELKDTDGFVLEDVKDEFEDAFKQIWHGYAENDSLNALILNGASWQQVNILRTYLNYLRQVKFPYSRRYMEQILVQYADISADVVRYFLARHRIDQRHAADKDMEAIEKDFLKKLDGVSQLDHDRILRGFMNLAKHTLRTNFFQRQDSGEPKDWLAFKIQSRDLDFVPKPRPHVEIFVYSPRVEAVHLRGGPIARGGLRWSDRPDDFRTEVLGLVKAQNVKNAVIVPVGSKGGFVLKKAPKTGGREAFHAEGVACYKIFITAMLEITDNIIDGKIIKPKNVVCHDGDDPYLVVAADKGTATFSDIANGISLEKGFWLGDAFASGGSAGYDHKAMGITARGAWECVKRHFRELGKDIQSEDFTTVGVGDMGGDVFGNGMLLSEHTCLVGAFNHLHIFCDPTPNAAKSFKERKRLFETRGGWDKYNQKLLSKGGMIFERSAKSIKLTKEIKECFGIKETVVAPSDLMQAMLRSNVDLLWFGGIGTYIKSSDESHTDADDRANDALRINGRDINAKVVGEGANLGMTQLGRIEYARGGGRLNTDFIDNSAGVDCSDHEVNIKILLADIMTSHNMNLTKRNKLLERMTDQVADLVLKDNYQQSQAITMCEFDARDQMARTASFIRTLEREGKLDRQVEFLPDDEMLDRMIQAGEVFARPEFATIMCYSKIDFYQDLLASKLPGEEASLPWLFEYFPKNLKKYQTEIEGHKLKEEIIATNVCNTLINRMGPVFVQSRMEKTGATPANVARAFIVAVESFNARKMWKDIEALDNRVSADVQSEALYEVFSIVKRVITWLLRYQGAQDEQSIDTRAKIDMLSAGVDTLYKNITKLLPNHIKAQVKKAQAGFKEDGLPDKLAKRLAILRPMVSACDILKISDGCGGDISAIAKNYFDVGERLQIDKLREELRHIKTRNHWEARVLGSLNDDLYSYQARITSNIIEKYGCPVGTNSLVAQWVHDAEDDVANLDQLLGEIWRTPNQNASMLVLAGQRLQRLADR